MEHFTTKRSLFLVPSNKCNEELEKIDEFIKILNKSNIGILIENEINKNGRNEYNKYDLIATIIYCFSKFKSSVREIEELCTYDFMLMCLGRNIRKYFVLLDKQEIKSNYWEKPLYLQKEIFPYPKKRKRTDTKSIYLFRNSPYNIKFKIL